MRGMGRAGKARMNSLSSPLIPPIPSLLVFPSFLILANLGGDEIAGDGEGGVGVERGRIEHQGIFGLAQRCRRSSRITGVALAHIGEDALVLRGDTALAQLL